MKNLLVGILFGFLIASIWNNHVQAAQRELARIWVGTDLQLGMPKDAVIAKVAEAGYEINRLTTNDGDSWTVSKKNEKNEYDFVGSLAFIGGKLGSANHTLYSSFDQPAAKLARIFYFAIRDLETDHNTVCTLESENKETATFYSKTGMPHCGNRTISESVAKYQDQDEEGLIYEAVK